MPVSSNVKNIATFRTFKQSNIFVKLFLKVILNVCQKYENTL